MQEPNLPHLRPVQPSAHSHSQSNGWKVPPFAQTSEHFDSDKQNEKNQCIFGDAPTENNNNNNNNNIKKINFYINRMRNDTSKLINITVMSTTTTTIIIII